MENEICHCGKPLHYTDLSIKKQIDEMVERLGSHINVTCESKIYRVPRHYIELHGIKGELMDSYGFDEVNNE